MVTETQGVEAGIPPEGGVRYAIRWIGLTILLLALVCGAVLVVKVGLSVWRFKTYQSELSQLRQTLEPWRQNTPPAVNAHAWGEAAGFVTQTAVGNICFTPDYVSHDEVRRLRQDVEAKMAEGPASVETLDWLWRRLAQTGPSGVKYTTQFQPMWDEMKAWIKPPPVNSQPNGSPPPDGN
jgi:hypothetical protein